MPCVKLEEKKIALISCHSMTAIFSSCYVLIFFEYVIESWLIILT